MKGSGIRLIPDIDSFLKNKRFDFKKIEPEIIEYWKHEEIYDFNPDDSGEMYLIDTPPPYTNGSLHHGHAMSYSQLDIIARYHRMRKPTLLPICFDDNGLPTERFTEKKYDIKPGEHPDNFFELCKKEAGLNINQQIKQFEAFGFSHNHKISYRTIDELSTKITQENFIDLYQKGLIRREFDAQLYCTNCRTALAQADLESTEKDSWLTTIKFPTTDKTTISIATTRPEFLPACVAIFHHPDDKRYNSINTAPINPITGEELPWLADSRIDPEFGTGLMMCCTFGDQTDIELYREYNLPLKKIIDEEGNFNKIGHPLEGLSIRQGKIEIMKLLDMEGLLIGKKKIKHDISICERCETPMEILPSEQWKLDVLNYKEDLISFIKKIKWNPPYMRKRMINWIEGLKWDWIISRQRYYGIPIPIWYCQDCKSEILPSKKDLPINSQKAAKLTCYKCSSNNTMPETDIFDTWFTSSLTPKILSEIYFEDKINRSFELRFQAHEIIRTWAFYTLTKYFHLGKIPWNTINIGGWGLGFKGKGKRAIKAAKSSGSGIDPLELIGNYGADVLRYWAAQARPGKDQHLNEAVLNRARKLITKIYNAGKIVYMISIEQNFSNSEKLKTYTKKMIRGLDELRDSYEELMDKFNYTDALRELENQFWNTFCSKYIELFKGKMYNQELYQEDASQLREAFIEYLKLFAPFFPFISEYLHMIFSRETETYKSIHESNLITSEQ